MRRSKKAMVPVCSVCGAEFRLDVGRRARTWEFGLVGVRRILCSYRCALTWDDEHRPEVARV